MGLGVYPSASLRDARVRALAVRSQIDSGHDPTQERRREQVITEREVNVPTFLQAAEKTHETAKSGWKHADGRNARRWLSSVKMHLASLLDCRVDTLKPRDFAVGLMPTAMIPDLASACERHPKRWTSIQPFGAF